MEKSSKRSHKDIFEFQFFSPCRFIFHLLLCSQFADKDKNLNTDEKNGQGLFSTYFL